MLLWGLSIVGGEGGRDEVKAFRLALITDWLTCILTPNFIHQVAPSVRGYTIVYKPRATLNVYRLVYGCKWCAEFVLSLLVPVFLPLIAFFPLRWEFFLFLSCSEAEALTDAHPRREPFLSQLQTTQPSCKMHKHWVWHYWGPPEAHISDVNSCQVHDSVVPRAYRAAKGGSICPWCSWLIRGFCFASLMGKGI